MMDAVTFVSLALMGCCLGETFIGTTGRFSSKDNGRVCKNPSELALLKQVS